MNKVESLHASEVIVAVILAKHEFSLLNNTVQSNNCDLNSSASSVVS